MFGTFEIIIIGIALIFAAGSVPKAIEMLPKLGHSLGTMFGQFQLGKKEMKAEVAAVKEVSDEVKSELNT